MDLASLFEMDWYDKSALTNVLRRNRGRWIHFSNGAPNRDIWNVKLLPEPEKPTHWDRRTNRRYQRDLAAVKRKNAVHSVPKIGINPRSKWQDPKGIYFYPVDWLLSGAERVRSGNQFGLNYSYYYIADLNLNDPNGINLDSMTWQDVEAIARRNGWFDQMQEFRQSPAEEQQRKLFTYARPDLPGSFFWHFIDRMVKDGQMRWTQAYRGLSYIRDPNLSIIHSNEPDQVLVLDPRLIKVVEFGENKHPVKAGSGEDSLEQWWHVLLNIIKQVRGEFGGDITWKNKRPTLSFNQGSGKFLLTIPERSTFGAVGLNLSYTYGRAYDSLSIGYRDLAQSTPPQIVTQIIARVNKIANRKSDLLFTPIVSIAEGKQIMLEHMTNNLGLSISTRIYNAEGEDRRYNEVRLQGESQREMDRVLVRTNCSLTLKPAEIDGSCGIWAGKHHLISAMIYGNEFTELPPLFAALSAKVRENLTNMLSWFEPRKSDGRMYDRHARFDSAETMTAFIGWLILKSGLSLGGLLTKEFASEIAAFEDHPAKRVLLADIAYVMNSNW